MENNNTNWKAEKKANGMCCGLWAVKAKIKEYLDKIRYHS